MGSGKTTVLAEASDILKSRKIPHAAIDLDALAVAHIPERPDDNAMYENLSSISRNCDQLGVARLVVARAIESRAEVDRCSRLVGATKTVVCRLTATEQTMEKRVAERERGMLRQQLIERVTKLNTILDTAGIEDFSIPNENAAVTEVAHEMLIRAGWISE
jgi:predicted subunit of tRNA(5-methylaminomethyl-2-thiouridylate) methyltransferase